MWLLVSFAFIVVSVAFRQLIPQLLLMISAILRAFSHWLSAVADGIDGGVRVFRESRGTHTVFQELRVSQREEHIDWRRAG